MTSATRQAIKIGAGALALAIAGLFVWSFNSCALGLDEGDRVMREELARAKLDLRYLSRGQFSPESCTVSYTYKGGGKDLDYVVLDDPLHGPKPTMWDNERGRTGE